MKEILDVKLPLSLEQIKEIIPHRDPFLYVDSVIGFNDNIFLECEKHFTEDEPFFAGHFPDRPLVPGVIMLEALAQAGILFAKLSSEGSPPDKLMVFTGTKEVRFRRQVVPGETLHLRVENYRRKFGHWKIDGTVTVGGELAATATLTAAEVEME